MRDLPFRLLPGVRVPDGLDATRVERLVCEVIRVAHPRPPDDPHEGAPVEEAFVRSIVRRGGWHIRFGYFLDAHANSRYDKSRMAEGKLRLSPDGEVLELRLGPLEYGMDVARRREARRARAAKS